MKMREFVWQWLLDPIVSKVERRLAHYQSMRSVTHDGSVWRNTAVVGEGVCFYPTASLQNYLGPEAISIGAWSHIKGEMVVHRGRIVCGTHCFVGEGTRLWASTSICIGTNVLISHLVDIHDSNSHSSDWRDRRLEISARFERGDHAFPANVASAPIIIEDDVWIGFKSSVLKGVTIGRGAIIAAGSVVTRDVEPFTMVAGNPARFVKRVPE